MYFIFFQFCEEYQAIIERMLQQSMKEPIILKNFLDHYRDMVKRIPLNFNIENLQVNDVELEKIKANCSLDLLEQPNDARVEDFVPGTDFRRPAPKLEYPRETNLKFVEKLAQHKDKWYSNPFKRTCESFNLLPIPTVPNDNKTLLNFFNEIIVTVRFYRPGRVRHLGKQLEKPFFSQEFECLGSNLLTELRDKIFCYCNKCNFFDISENPEADLPEKDTDPGFFFIYDTFYNDKRNPLNPDYSKTIIDWAKTAYGLKNVTFKTKNMEETCFLDLIVSLGFPYLYLHHGNCEHVFTISQIEMLSPSSTCHYKEQYPRIKSNNIFSNRKCCLCGVRPFVYVVQDSLKQIINPSYVCVNCLHSYYYIDGKKVDDFKLYRICESLATVNDSDEDDTEEMPKIKNKIQSEETNK